MTESFLGLGVKDRRKILQKASQKLEHPPAILEKDVWLCWVLGQLFALPPSIPMAF